MFHRQTLIDLPGAPPAPFPPDGLPRRVPHHDGSIQHLIGYLSGRWACSLVLGEGLPTPSPGTPTCPSGHSSPSTQGANILACIPTGGLQAQIKVRHNIHACAFTQRQVVCGHTGNSLYNKFSKFFLIYSIFLCFFLHLQTLHSIRLRRG